MSSFICHRTKFKSSAIKFCNELKKVNISYWLDTERMLGVRLSTKLSKALDDMTVFVLILSDGINNSPYTRDEMNVAKERRVPVFGLLFDPDYKIDGLARLTCAGQYKFDLSTDEKFDAAMPLLIQKLQYELGKKESSETTASEGARSVDDFHTRKKPTRQ